MVDWSEDDKAGFFYPEEHLWYSKVLLLFNIAPETLNKCSKKSGFAPVQSATPPDHSKLVLTSTRCLAQTSGAWVALDKNMYHKATHIVCYDKSEELHKDIREAMDRNPNAIIVDSKWVLDSLQRRQFE